MVKKEILSCRAECPFVISLRDQRPCQKKFFDNSSPCKETVPAAVEALIGTDAKVEYQGLLGHLSVWAGKSPKGIVTDGKLLMFVDDQPQNH